MNDERTLTEELRDELKKLYAEAGGGHVAIRGILALAERLVEVENAQETPGDWRVVGGNRIAIFQGDEVIRIAEFYSMYDIYNLPADANAALAVTAVGDLRKREKRATPPRDEAEPESFREVRARDVFSKSRFGSGRPSGWGNQ